MSINPYKVRRVEPGPGTDRNPAFWGKAINFVFEDNSKRWSKPIELNLDPIDIFTYAGAKKTDMSLLGGVYTLGPENYGRAANDPIATVIIITTSRFDVENNDDKSPMQLITDNDVVFRASTLSNNTNPVTEKDLDILPVGSVMEVAVPSLWLYAWRGGTGLAPGKTLTGITGADNATNPNNKLYFSFRLAYKMIDLSAEKKLDLYQQQTNNASFLDYYLGMTN